MVSTTPIEVALAPGESTTVALTASVDYNTYPNRNRYDVVENVTGTNVYVAWWDVTPYKPSLKVRDGSNNLIDSGTALSFGMVTEAVSKTYKIQNTGAAPMHIESITLPEGFTSSVADGTTVDPDGELEWVITFNPTESGIYSGDIVLKIADIADDFKFVASGTMLDTSKYFINFEDNTMPDGSLNLGGSSWSIKYINTTDNKYALMSGSYDPSYMFILPLLKVEEGEKMSIDIVGRSSNSFVKIYHSTDRENWTLAKTYTKDDFQQATESWWGGNKYPFTSFVIDNIPAGNQYIAIESGYAFVDNIYGFERVAVAHDVVAQSFTAPASGMVNYDLSVAASFLNVNDQPEAAGSYTATFYVNDEAVATAEAAEIAAAGTANFSFAYTPHAAGDYTAYVELAFGDYKVKTDVATITVAEESFSSEITIGEKYGTSSNLPLTLGYCNSESECIYTADVLGLTSGTKIAGLYINGSKNSEDLTTTVTIWMQNTDDDAVMSSGTETYDVENMTKVFEGTYTFKNAGGTAPKLLNVMFSQPFEYTGSNVRIIFRSLCDGWKSTSFDTFQGEAGQATWRYSDGNLFSASFRTTSYGRPSLPVLNLLLDAEAPTMSGRVVKVDGTPVADAEVALTSGNVLYTATTDAEGNYSATIFQADKTYTATLTAGDYEKAKTNISFAEGNVVANFMTPGTITLESGKKAALCLPEYPADENLAFFEISKVEGTEVTLSKSDAIIDGAPYVIIPTADVDVVITEIPDAEDGGVAGIGGVKLQGTYDFITVASDSAGTIYSLLNNDFTKVEAATEILPLRAFVVADGDYTFTFENDPTGAELIGVDGVAGNADVYNLQGQRVGKASDIKSLEKGIYIVNGKKVALTK